MDQFQTLLQAAYNEWKIQIRLRTTWMLAGLFFLVGWYSVDRALLPLLPAVSIARSTAQGLGLFGSLFVAILGAAGFLREFQPSYGFLWGRAFSVFVYVLGKYLGMCAAAGASLLPAGLWAAYLLVTLHGYQGILVLAQVWGLILAPTLLFVLAATLLVAFVLRSWLWTSLIMVGALGAGLALNLDVTHWTAFAPFSIYASPLIGYGPDGRLLLLHRLFYLGLTALILLFGLSLARAAAPRREQKPPPASRLVWGVCVSGALALTFFSIALFQEESQAISTPPPADPLVGHPADCAFIDAYQVEVVLNHQSTRVDGKVSLQLRSTTNFLAVPLDLNSGLLVTRVEAEPAGTRVEVDQGVLALSSPAEFGEQAVSVVLEYTGRLRAQRYEYDRIFRTPELRIAPFHPGGYLDRTTAFLTRDGNWRPFPGCAPDRLAVAVVGAPEHMIHTADRRETSADRVTLIWEQRPPLPLFAASRLYRRLQVEGAAVLIAPRHLPEGQLEAVLFPYAALLSQMETYLAEEKQPGAAGVQIAVTPLLKYSSYDPSSGVFFLPEALEDAPLLLKNPASFQDPLYVPDLLYRRWAAEQVLRAWWRHSETCSLLQAYGASASYLLAFTLPGSSEASAAESQTVLNALITYAALQLAEPLLGQEFVAEEIRARQRMLEDQVLWINTSLPLDHSPEINRLVVRLHRLWEATGPGPFWRLAREYRRQYGTVSLPEDQFTQFVEQVTGVNLPPVFD